MSFHIATDHAESEEGNLLVVLLEGQLNTQGADTAQHYLQILLNQQRKPVHLLLDGSRLTYLNSSGLRTLAQFSRDLRKAGRRLALCAAPDTLQGLVELSGLSSVILMYPTLDDARTALKTL